MAIGRKDRIEGQERPDDGDVSDLSRRAVDVGDLTFPVPSLLSPCSFPVPNWVRPTQKAHGIRVCRFSGSKTVKFPLLFSLLAGIEDRRTQPYSPALTWENEMTRVPATRRPKTCAGTNLVKSRF